MHQWSPRTATPAESGPIAARRGSFEVSSGRRCLDSNVRCKNPTRSGVAHLVGRQFMHLMQEPRAEDGRDADRARAPWAHRLGGGVGRTGVGRTGAGQLDAVPVGGWDLELGRAPRPAALAHRDARLNAAVRAWNQNEPPVTRRLVRCVAKDDAYAGSLARWRCIAARRDRLIRPWRSTSMTTTITSSPTDTTSSTVGT